MSYDPISLEVEIPNANALDENTGADPLVFWSQTVTHQGLAWTAEARIRKRSPNDGRNSPKFLFAYIHCTNPLTENESWKVKARCKARVVELNSRYQDEYVAMKEGTLDFDNSSQEGGGGWALISVEEVLEREFVKDDSALVKFTIRPESISGLHLAQKRRISDDAVYIKGQISLALLRTGFGANVTLLTKDVEKLGAHRATLMMSSPVFVAMLGTSGMNETGGGDIHVSDLTAACLRHVLEYIYGAPLSSLDNIPLPMAKELIYVSEKYDLEELKEYCATLLLERVGPGNMIQTHMMAKKYKLDEASRKELEEYIKDHIPELLAQMDQGTLEEAKGERDDDDVAPKTD